MKEKITIYSFWIGDLEKKQKIIDKFNLLKNKYKNVDFILGPSNEEHDYLYQNFPFYKANYDIKKYSFCADLWRIYILTLNKGLYIDSQTIINLDQFNEFLDKLQNKDGAFLYESRHLVWNGFLYNNNNFDFFKELLNIYLKKWKYCNKKTGPYILSCFLYKNYKKYLKDKNIVYFDARNIDPFGDSFFKYNGLSSWKQLKKPNENLIYFNKCAQQFNKKDFWYFKFARFFMKLIGIFNLR